MLREYFQGLLYHNIALGELSFLLVDEGSVEEGFEAILGKLLGGGEIGASLLDVGLAELEHT